MKYKVDELNDEKLDQAIFLIEIHRKDEWTDYQHGFYAGWRGPMFPSEDYEFAPSKEWGIAGDIIERERISLRSFSTKSDPLLRWEATPDDPTLEDRVVSIDFSALNAAMRAYVKSKHGDEIDLPGEDWHARYQFAR